MHGEETEPKAAANAAARPDSQRSPWWSLLWIALITVWAYWPAVNGTFIWDDNSYVRDNTLLHSASGLWRIWFEPTATPQYHPLVFSSFWLEYSLWGTNPPGYHLVNLALHVLNTLLFWTILRRLDVAGATFAAAVFALHPVHVESVAWISERKDVLSAFFYGSTVLVWLTYLQSRRARHWLLATALLCLTLLSKSVLCTLPVALALLALWRKPASWREWSLRLAPSLAIAAVMAAVNVWREHAQNNPPLPYDLLERTLIAARALWTHVGSLVWPIDLTIAYSHWPVSTADFGAYLYLLAAILVPVLFVVKRRSWGSGPLVAIGFFALTLAPMLGFVDYNIMQFAFAADHFSYVASAGLIALAASAATTAARHLPAEQRAALSVLPLAALAWLTWNQAGLYVDAETMWRNNIARNPQSWTGHVNLAGVLARAGKTEEAAGELKEALRVNPDAVVAHTHLGIVLAALQRPQEAIEHFETAIRLNPSRADAENNLGAVLMTLGRVAEAETHFRQAVANNAAYAEAWRHWAIAALRLGDREAAISRLEEAVRLRPDFAAARADLEKLKQKQ